MSVLRTPDRRFEHLEEYDFEPNYSEVTDGQSSSLRIHYLDEGPPASPPVLLLHGEPTWSYLYRRVIPVLVEAGHRCIAADLVGFGRSDKPAAASAYTYARQVAWMRSLLIDHLDLRHITLFGHDWGGLIGLRLVAAHPARFDRVVISNTALPTGDEPRNDALEEWQKFSRDAEDFPVGQIVNCGCVTDLSSGVVAAYDAPFPDESFKAGVRVFPSLVPTRPDDPAHDDNVAAWQVIRRFDRPFLCAFSDKDPITRGAAKRFISLVPGARGQAHTTISGAGHFLQEDRGIELARIIREFITTTHSAEEHHGVLSKTPEQD